MMHGVFIADKELEDVLQEKKREFLIYLNNEGNLPSQIDMAEKVIDAYIVLLKKEVR